MSKLPKMPLVQVMEIRIRTLKLNGEKKNSKGTLDIFNMLENNGKTIQKSHTLVNVLFVYFVI